MDKTNNSGVKQVTFRRFGRKGWCIFRSLSLNIRIGVLSVATLATAISYKAHAEVISDERSATVEDDGTDLDEVTVQTSIAPLTTLQSARIVTVITRREIEQAGATTVNDLLKLASGVDQTGYSRKVVGKIEKWADAGLPEPPEAQEDHLRDATKMMRAAVVGVWERIREVLQV